MKYLGKKTEELAVQQRLEEEMVKAEAELKKEEEKEKVENAAAQQCLEEEMTKTEADHKKEEEEKKRVIDAAAQQLQKEKTEEETKHQQEEEKKGRVEELRQEEETAKVAAAAEAIHSVTAGESALPTKPPTGGIDPDGFNSNTTSFINAMNNGGGNEEDKWM